MTSVKTFYLLSLILAAIISLLLASINLAIAQTRDTVSANIEKLLTQRSCIKCNLHGADLSRLDLSGVDLQSADLSAANLTETNLRGANLANAVLLQATIIDTLLSGANLQQADLSDLDIDEAFESLEIIGTLLEGAHFKDDVICGKFPDKGGWGCQHQ